MMQIEWRIRSGMSQAGARPFFVIASEEFLLETARLVPHE
jgi:hypothetical protein